MLEQIQNTNDLKKLNKDELLLLSNELREALLYRLEHKGGHSGPNLGVVELTVALHYVFNTPTDKLIFDVSHQTYIHKMLTGRARGYQNIKYFSEITGFTNPAESEYDLFKIGHTSTSISLAVGMVKARELKNTSEKVIAVIGDASLGGGLALEGLSAAGDLKSNIIIVINDNNQSIAENHGGIYENLKLLRENNGKIKNNLFTAFGLEYHYVDNGHDINQLINKFNEVKDRNKPVVVHVKTIKGKGYLPAEMKKEKFHSGPAIDLQTANYKTKIRNEYNIEMRNLLESEMNKDKLVTVITAGTPNTLTFTSRVREKYPNQFIDTGITEAHALTMAGAMAKNGVKPILGISSTFFQRAFDQMIHDIAINRLPVTILIYMSGINGFKDVTHLGFYDIPMIINVPNMIYLAPTSIEEQEAMTRYAIHQSENPIAIKIPTSELVRTGIVDQTDYAKLNKFQLTQKGTEAIIIGVGSFYQLAQQTAKYVKEKVNIDLTVINPKFISGVDTELLKSLIKTHKLLITIEDGQINGGFGSMISSYLADEKIMVKNFGFKKEFVDCYEVDDLLEKENLTSLKIGEYIIKNINK